MYLHRSMESKYTLLDTSCVLLQLTLKHVKAQGKEKNRRPKNKCTHTRTHCHHITPPDAILNIGLQSAAGIIYLDSGYKHIHQ